MKEIIPTNSQLEELDRRLKRCEINITAISEDVKSQRKQFISIKNDLHAMIKKLDAIIGR